MPQWEGGADRRRQSRLPIQVPVRVRGREASGDIWEEFTSCLDASVGGVSMLVTHPVVTGQVLHLSVPLPSRFRQFDMSESSYRVYSLVRNARPAPRGTGAARVGVMFLGQYPPRGAETLPSELYLMPGDRMPTTPARQPLEAIRLRLAADQAPGGVAIEEDASVEHVAPRVATVKVSRLPVLRGSILAIEEIGGDFRSRAEVSGIAIGEDGHPRLRLHVLDAAIPDRLLPGGGAGGH